MPKPPRRHARYLLTLLVLPLATGCERPFVETAPVVLAESAPDLSVVQTEEVLPLRLRVSDAGSTERVTVNGEVASRAAEAGLFLDTLLLEVGLNTLFVAVFDDEGNVTEDTLYAAYLPYASGFAEPLPEGRYAHSATGLADGRVLLAGGFREAGALGSALLAEEVAGPVAYSPLPDGLNHPRGGHSATLLPDGRVLVLGGATRDGATAAAQFVTEAELYDPAAGTFTVAPVKGEPLRRYAHTALALESDERVFIYVYGGIEANGDGAAPTGTLVVLELREEGGTDLVSVVSPPGGIGSLPSASAPALLPLPTRGGLARALAVGTDVGGLEPVPFARRLTFRPSTMFFPFEIAVEPVAPPDTTLARFAAAPVAPGLLLLAGGSLETGTSPTKNLRLYADEAGRFFTFPEDVGLRLPRARHTATLLPSGRILVVGGTSAGSGALAPTELIGPN